MKTYVTVFCLMSAIRVVESAQLDIIPSTNIQPGAATLTVRCQPTTASGVTSVYRLDVLRLREGVSTEQSLGTIQVTNQPVLGPGLTSPKYTLSGSLTSIVAVSTSFLQIVIQDPNCNDNGEYVCRVTGGNSGGPLNPEQRTNVTVQENPSEVDMNIFPSRSNLEYALNESISFTCNGNVGNPAQTWQWQTRRFPASTQWIRYTDDADIVTDPVTPPSGTRCSYRQRTVLNYRVKEQDDGLQIRCILNNREEFSRNFTVHYYDFHSVDMSNTCTVSLKEKCFSSFKSKLSYIKNDSDGCRLVDSYLDCIKSCDNQDEYKAAINVQLADKGIKCVMVTLDMSYGDCPPAVKDSCNSVAKTAVDKVQTNAQYCRLVDIYLDCIKSCDKQDKHKAAINVQLAEQGIKCGSAMVTQSGTMVILMLFTTLRPFF